MSKFYRKATGSGPVPFPDNSGKMLEEGEIVTGPGWAELEALNFVVEVDPPLGMEKLIQQETSDLGPQNVDFSSEKLDNTDTNGSNDGIGTEGLVTQETGSTNVVPGIGTGTPGRRGRGSKKMV